MFLLAGGLQVLHRVLVTLGLGVSADHILWLVLPHILFLEIEQFDLEVSLLFSKHVLFRLLIALPVCELLKKFLDFFLFELELFAFVDVLLPFLKDFLL